MGWFRNLIQSARDARADRNAIRDVKRVMESGRVNGVPYADLDRADKFQLLDRGIEWDEYVDNGMHPDLPDLIIFNAVDGKPRERWLEQTPEEAKAREAELSRYDQQFEAATERISEAIRAREESASAPEPLAQIRQTINAAAKAQGHNKGKEAEPEL